MNTSLKPRIIAFTGSTRRDSYNRKLLNIAIAGAEAAGAEVTTLNLTEFALPLFEEDIERDKGTPENAIKLRQVFLQHQGLLIAAPEYNSSITPLLKNTIDWVSRGGKGEEPLAAYKGKVAALLSASPGGLGGLRGLVHIRSILGNIGVVVLPDQIAVSRAFDAFNFDGTLKDPRQHSAATAIGATLANFLIRLGTNELQT